MTVYTTKKAVTFVNPFVLGDFDAILLPAKSGHRSLSRTLTIDPNVLDAALKRDEASSTTSPERTPVPKPSKGTPNTHEAETDRQAVDRADDEGMIIHPQ